jgi:hypothetical protein
VIFLTNDDIVKVAAALENVAYARVIFSDGKTISIGNPPPGDDENDVS